MLFTPKTQRNILQQQLEISQLLKEESYNNCPQFLKDIKKEFGSYMLEKIIEKFTLQSLVDKETLFKIGDIANKFYIVLSGKLGVFMEYQDDSNDIRKVREIIPQQQIGEIGLYNPNCKRNQTVIALEQTNIATLTRQDYQQLIGRLKQDQTDRKIELLSKLDCFSNWTLRQFKNFSYFLVQQHYCLNEIVYKENDSSQFLYLVQEGQFEMTVSIHSSKNQLKKKIQTICIFNEGQIFGEEAFMNSIDQDPEIQKPFDNNDQQILRYSTVKCIGITGNLFRISKQDIIERCWDDSTLFQFTQLLIQLKNFRLSRIDTLESFSNLKMLTDPESNYKIKNYPSQQKKQNTILEPIFSNTYFRKYYQNQQQKPVSKYSNIIKRPKFKVKQLLLNSFENNQSSMISPKQSLSKKSQQFHKLLSQRYQKTSQKKDQQNSSFEFPSNNIGYLYYKQFIASERAKSLQY